MTREEYIKYHAIKLKKLADKRKRLSERFQVASYAQAQRLSAELNWVGMYIEQTEERIAFALGRLLPENATKEYRPSSFHTYPGIRGELEKTKFDR